MSVGARWKVRAVAAAVLALLVVAAYWPVFGNDFVGFDDERYVTGNPHVRSGLSAAGFTWAWTGFHAANWHPLTWLSHQLDWELFGPRAAGHHLTSLLLHVANTLLVFFVFGRLTSSPVRSALVAVLFGIHPLGVESVAWVAERKNVLSTLFWLLALLAWTAYVRSPNVRRYALVMLAAALGLCAKPMLVTLPLTLLLLDYWPLNRIASAADLRSRLLEKVPLFALSLGSSVVTFMAQRAGGAVVSLETFPFDVRLANAVIACAAYLRRTFWPTGLAVPYPHPGSEFALSTLVISAAVIATITLLAILGRKRHPYLLFGWLWLLVTLAPVIGIVQVGSQASADRYTYVPLIGFFVMLAWGIPSAAGPLLSRRTESDEETPVQRDTGLLALGCLLVPLLTAATWSQLAHWRDDETLARRALAVTENNAVAHNQLGLALARGGRPSLALEQHERAIEISPGFAEAHNNLGGALVEVGRVDEAVDQYREAIRLRVSYPEARLNLGVALVRLSRLGEAVEQFEEAARLRPGYGKAHANLAAAYFTLGQLDRARDELDLARQTGFEPPPSLVRSIEAAGAPGG